MNVQWYPGHMAKTRRTLERDISGVDAVIEMTDARLPHASRNSEFTSLWGDKPVLTVLGRADLADPVITGLWLKTAANSAAVNAVSPEAAKIVVRALRALLKERVARFAAKEQTGRMPRVMVVGIPNSGKSTLINTLLRRKAAKAEDRPGVTRENKWYPMEQGFLLLDTPGMLPPKIHDPEDGLSLAFTGAVRDEILDAETLAVKLIERLGGMYPDAIPARYGITGEITLETLAAKRGYRLSGGVLDLERMALALLDDFRSGKLGRISLERPV